MGGTGSVVGFLSVSRVTLERVACVVAGLVALASFTFVGHPQASRPRGFLLVSQAVHVAAAAVWFGGGALLAMEIHRRWRYDSPRAMAETIERFSTLAGVSVALVAITGIVLAHSQLASPEALVTSHYGRALLAKLAFVGLVAAIGATTTPGWSPPSSSGVTSPPGATWAGPPPRRRRPSSWACW